MRIPERGTSVLAALLCGVMLVACSEPTKPVKKLNIKRASDFEPISAPMAPSSDTATDTVESGVSSQEGAATELEIVEVQGFRGQCDSSFVGINEEGLVTVRNATQVSTVKLAGVSLPEGVRNEAQNQVRIWLDKKSISVEVDESAPSIDSAVYLYVCPDGAMINEELVRAGLAIPSETRYRRSEELKKASIEALTAGRGVWGKSAQ